MHWGQPDTLLIDLPPGTDDVALTLLELLPEARLLAVTTPQVAAQTVAARVGTMARDARMPVAGVVENMTTLVCPHCDAATPLFGEGGGTRLAAFIDPASVRGVTQRTHPTDRHESGQARPRSMRFQ